MTYFYLSLILLFSTIYVSASPDFRGQWCTWTKCHYGECEEETEDLLSPSEMAEIFAPEGQGWKVSYECWPDDRHRWSCTAKGQVGTTSQTFTGTALFKKIASNRALSKCRRAQATGCVISECH